MKRLMILCMFLLVGVFGYSQATNVGEMRIANATTAFGVNLPVGTKVYDIGTGSYWVATAGVISTATLTTASASFTQLNGGAAAQDLSYNATTHAIDITGGGTSAVVPLASADGVTEGLSSFTATDFNATAGNISIDYVNGQKATNAQPGLATASHISAIEANTAKTSNVSTALSTGTVGASTYGITSDGGADDVIIAAATNTASGVATAAQITKLEGIATGAEVNKLSFTESFEEISGTATAHALTYTAITAEGAVVSINGSVLKPSLYTLTTTTITMGVPVYQYDQVTIKYKH